MTFGPQVLFYYEAPYRGECRLVFCSHRFVAIAAHNAGYEVHIATTFTKSSGFDHLSDYGFKPHRLNIDRSGKNIVSYFDTALRLSALFIALKPDIIHLVTIQPVLIGGFLQEFLNPLSGLCPISGLGHSFVGNSLFSRLDLIVLICCREALKVKSRRYCFRILMIKLSCPEFVRFPILKPISLLVLVLIFLGLLIILCPTWLHLSS